MSRDVGRDLSASPETEQLLSGHVPSETLGARTTPQPAERWSVSEPRPRSDVSLSGATPQGTSTRLRPDDTQIEVLPCGDPTATVTSLSIVVDDGTVENDDPPPYTAIPPPYSAIVLPNHVGWPYGPLSYAGSYPADDAPPYRAQMPLAPFQASPTAPTAAAFHPEGTNGLHASLTMPLTPYRFFKFGCRRSSLMLPTANEIAEKIDDRKSRRYGAILVAAAVIIFLMVLSLMVRFVMERSWWRG